MKDTATELRYAKEGLQQIQQAYEDGEYSDKQAYVRDCKAAEQSIARLEKKLSNE